MDIINEIVDQSKYNLKIVSYPEKRDISLLDKGLIDFRIDPLVIEKMGDTLGNLHERHPLSVG